jgi:putative protein-disulfide isomerase
MPSPYLLYFADPMCSWCYGFEVAAELGFGADSFRAELLSDAAKQETAQDFAISQSAGIRGFPTLIAGNPQNNEYALVTRGFQRAEHIIPALEKWRAAIG